MENNDKIHHTEYVIKLYSMYYVPIQALMSLFVLASKDGWVNIMYSGLDAVGVDLQVSTLYDQQSVISQRFSSIICSSA